MPVAINGSWAKCGANSTWFVFKKKSPSNSYLNVQKQMISGYGGRNYSN